MTQSANTSPTFYLPFETSQQSFRKSTRTESTFPAVDPKFWALNRFPEKLIPLCDPSGRREGRNSNSKVIRIRDIFPLPNSRERARGERKREKGRGPRDALGPFEEWPNLHARKSLLCSCTFVRKGEILRRLHKKDEAPPL